MTSKYDAYWLTELGNILALFEQTETGETSASLALGGLDALGERDSWYGKLEIVNGKPVYDTAAHLRALGMLLAPRLPEWTTTHAWIVTVGQDLRLTVERTKPSHTNWFESAYRSAKLEETIRRASAILGPLAHGSTAPNICHTASGKPVYVVFSAQPSGWIAPRRSRLETVAASGSQVVISLTNEDSGQFNLWIIPATDVIAAIQRSGYAPALDRGNAYSFNLETDPSADVIRQLNWDIRPYRCEADQTGILRATFWPDEPVIEPPSYDRGKFLTHTYLQDEQADDLYHLLLDKKQIILYGPPGTGKSYVAQELAKWITGLAQPPADRVEMVQFHPAYSYEDFIEGIRPESKPTGNGGFAVDYPPRSGVFRRFCQVAQANPDQRHVFIIDEINRGNIPRIFGELMLLLEYRERDVPLPYSGERFRIPPNVYLIGTMNTADRSIALVDFALRRRFHFFHFRADPDLLERWLADNPLSVPYLATLYRRLSQEAIDDPDYALGFSYFMDKGLTPTKLARIWQYSILPYLTEYHVEQRARVKNWEWESDFMRGIRGEA